jgi:glutamyl-tRNA synthetase/glutamyl-Q tRNA(Asp) synthetase
VSVVSRFAPAPTGFLHLGHVLSALWVWRTARARGGRVLLRVEDHDRVRSRPEYESALLEDLAWLGFQADEPFVRQSDRGDLYAAALDRLRARGLVYACDCSRADVQRAGGARGAGSDTDEIPYPGTCRERHLAETIGRGLRVRLDSTVERFVDVRLGSQAQQPSRQCGDLLVKDRDGNWTYQFAATVDDWLQGVTLVVRGEDLLPSTGRQIQLARVLGRREPPAFLHHPLVMKSAGQKLSKAEGDTGIRVLRARGWTAEAVIEEAARLDASWPPAGTTG